MASDTVMINPEQPSEVTHNTLKESRLCYLQNPNEVKNDPVIEVLNENPSQVGDNLELRRSGRRRSLPKVQYDPTQPKNLISTNRTHRILNLEDDIAELNKIYLDKTVKKTSSSLETIYEDSDKKMGGRKLKRVLTFTDTASSIKLKRRSLKVQKLSSHNRKITKQISMKFLKDKLAKVDPESTD